MTTMSCNIEECNNKAVETVIFENGDGFFIVDMCAFHHSKYRSDMTIGKPFNLEGVAVQEQLCWLNQSINYFHQSKYKYFDDVVIMT
jgi:hypothetical protein